jgi:hypothetical protein
LRFYRNDCTDARNRYLADIQGWSHEKLESVHDYIQWMFPSDEESMFNGDAPDFPPEVQEVFRTDETIRKNLHKSFDVFLDFLGLAFCDGQVVRQPHFEKAARNWLGGFMNHNWLRITRVLKCLSLCGEEERGRAFFDQLRTIHEEGLMANRRTFAFWRAAVEGKRLR